MKIQAIISILGSEYSTFTGLNHSGNVCEVLLVQKDKHPDQAPSAQLCQCTIALICNADWLFQAKPQRTSLP